MVNNNMQGEKAEMDEEEEVEKKTIINKHHQIKKKKKRKRQTLSIEDVTQMTKEENEAKEKLKLFKSKRKGEGENTGTTYFEAFRKDGSKLRIARKRNKQTIRGKKIKIVGKGDITGLNMDANKIREKMRKGLLNDMVRYDQYRYEKIPHHTRKKRKSQKIKVTEETMDQNVGKGGRTWRLCTEKDMKAMQEETKKIEAKPHEKPKTQREGGKKKVILSEEEKKKKDLKRKKERAFAATEILTSEEKYVAGLETMITCYVKPLRAEGKKKEKGIVTSEQCKTLFSSIEVILNYNKIFLENCRRVLTEYNENNMISDIFNLTGSKDVGLDTFVHYFKSYTNYSNNFNDANALIKVLRKQEGFSNFEKEAKKLDMTKGLDLQSFLILPVQRIPRYKMLIEQVIRFTKEDHPDYHNLKRAYEGITSVATHMNETISKLQDGSKLIEIQLQFSEFPNNFQLVQPHRKLKYEGSIQLESPDFVSSYIHLFNDGAMFSRFVKYSLAGGLNPYLFMHFIPLAKAKLYLVDTPAKDSTRDHLRFKLEANNGRQFVFLTKSTEHKVKWITNFQECIQTAEPFQDAVGKSTTTTKKSKSTLKLALLQHHADQFTLTPEECIQILKTKGTNLIKCGRQGYPQYRHFLLSEDEQLLYWGSVSKTINDSNIKLSSVICVRQGQHTPLFEKQNLKAFDRLSFSFVSTTRTLDLVATSKLDYQIWNTALPTLLSRVHDSRPGACIVSNEELNDAKAKMERLEQQFTVDEGLAEIGDAMTWGQNSHGCLGHHDTRDRNSPTVMKDFLYLDIYRIYVGRSSFAIMVNGALFSWGSGDHGITCHGDTEHRSSPERVAYFQSIPVKKVAMGTNHAIILSRMGQVYACGRNAYGQLGVNSSNTASQFEPQPVYGLDDHTIVDIVSGSDHCAALDDQGVVYMWGKGSEGQLGLGDLHHVMLPTKLHIQFAPVKEIALGMMHSLALTVDGKLISWGRNNHGQLGNDLPDNVNELCFPQLVVATADMDFDFIACGASHSCAVSNKGKLFMWGSNQFGQLGLGDHLDRRVPTLVPHVVDRPHQLALGLYHSLMLIRRPVNSSSNHSLSFLSNMLQYGRQSSEEDQYTTHVFSWGAAGYGRLGFSSDNKDVLVPMELTSFQKSDSNIFSKFIKGRQIPQKVRFITANGCSSGAVCAHHWIPDSECANCMHCDCGFHVFKRRHHCRYCGGVFCNDCTSKMIPLLRFGLIEPQRVCRQCHDIVTSELQFI